MQPIVSEDEQSVCRSEGSPPRTKPKRKSLKRKATQVGSVPKSAVIMTSDKSKNLKVRKQKTIENPKEAPVAQKQRTLFNVYKELRKPHEEPQDDEPKADDDGSDCCEMTDSDEELSAADMKVVHGNILNAIKKFDQHFNIHNKNKHLQYLPSSKDRSKERKKRRVKRDFTQLAQIKVEGPVREFQPKSSGNGGNPGSLAMLNKKPNEKDNKLPPFIPTSKRVIQKDLASAANGVTRQNARVQTPT